MRRWAGSAWGVTPVNAFVSTTMRYTTDRRILIRYLLRYCPSQRAPERELDEVRLAHEKVLRGRFPMLPEVSIDHTWTGYVCLSRNNAPGFGKIAQNVWSAVCCNAVGITKATIAGMLAADLACDVDNPLIGDMESLGTPQRRRPGRSSMWGSGSGTGGDCLGGERRILGLVAVGGLTFVLGLHKKPAMNMISIL